MKSNTLSRTTTRVRQVTTREVLRAGRFPRLPAIVRILCWYFDVELLSLMAPPLFPSTVKRS